MQFRNEKKLMTLENTVDIAKRLNYPFRNSTLFKKVKSIKT